MRHAAWVLAYHGCDEKIGKAILSGRRELRVSTNLYDWLGTGAYFWENSQARALQWANELKNDRRHSAPHVGKPFVVGAIIDPGNCLDLTGEESLRILQAAYPPFKSLLEMADTPMPKNEPSHTADSDLLKRRLDCAVINFLHRSREIRKQPPFDTVRCSFLEGGELFKGSKISSKSHLQWCVRDPKKSIVGFFRPRHLAPQE